MQRPGEGIPAFTTLKQPKINDGRVLFDFSPKDKVEEYILKYLMGFFDSSKDTYVVDGKETRDFWTIKPEGKYKTHAENKVLAQKWVDEYLQEENVPEKRPFAEDVIKKLFDNTSYYWLDEPNFKLQTPSEQKPTLITSQLRKVWWDGSLQPTSGNCTQASMNNACQKYITDFETLKKSGSQTTGPEEGIEFSTIKSYLERELGYKVKASEDFPKYVDLTKTRAAVANYTWHRGSTYGRSAHAVAIRDGWMVDSNNQPYTFKGKLEGYLGYGKPILQQVLQIKQRKSVFPDWTGLDSLDDPSGKLQSKYSRAPSFLTRGRDKPY